MFKEIKSGNKAEHDTVKCWKDFVLPS